MSKLGFPLIYVYLLPIFQVREHCSKTMMNNRVLQRPRLPQTPGRPQLLWTSSRPQLPQTPGRPRLPQTLCRPQTPGRPRQPRTSGRKTIHTPPARPAAKRHHQREKRQFYRVLALLSSIVRCLCSIFLSCSPTQIALCHSSIAFDEESQQIQATPATRRNHHVDDEGATKKSALLLFCHYSN